MRAHALSARMHNAYNIAYLFAPSQVCRTHVSRRPSGVAQAGLINERVGNHTNRTEERQLTCPVFVE